MYYYMEEVENKVNAHVLIYGILSQILLITESSQSEYLDIAQIKSLLPYCLLRCLDCGSEDANKFRCVAARARRLRSEAAAKKHNKQAEGSMAFYSHSYME